MVDVGEERDVQVLHSDLGDVLELRGDKYVNGHVVHIRLVKPPIDIDLKVAV